MLKIWKQAWKKEDPKRSHIELAAGSTSDTAQEDASEDFEGSSYVPLASTPSFDNVQIRTKRTTDDISRTSSDERESSRAAKRVKLDNSSEAARPDLPDSRSAIPEVLDSSIASLLPTSNVEEILRQAQSENSA
jgi:hypothetical protein